MVISPIPWVQRIMGLPFRWLSGRVVNTFGHCWRSAVAIHGCHGLPFGETRDPFFIQGCSHLCTRLVDPDDTSSGRDEMTIRCVVHDRTNSILGRGPLATRHGEGVLVGLGGAFGFPLPLPLLVRRVDHGVSTGETGWPFIVQG